MGATSSSLHEQRIATDLATVKGCLPDAATSIDWTREASVEAHSIINTLENCLFHRRSARTKRRTVRLPCTSHALPGRVSFDPVPVDIDTCAPFGSGSAKRDLLLTTLSVHQRVPTGFTLAPANKKPELSGKQWDSASCTSSVRSLDSTVPRFETDGTLASHPDIACNEPRPLSPERRSPSEVDLLDICELLTSGTNTRNCSPVDS